MFALVCGCSSPHCERTATQQFFKLDDKLQHVNMLRYFDGGTIGLELTDIHGSNSSICIDNEGFGIIIPKSEENLPETIEYINQRKKKCIYMGATHPDNKGAEKIEHNSDLEKSILDRIKLLMENNPEFEEEFSCFIEATESERYMTIHYEEDMTKYE